MITPSTAATSLTEGPTTGSDTKSSLSASSTDKLDPSVPFGFPSQTNFPQTSHQLGLSCPSTATRAPPPPKVPTNTYFPIMQQITITEFSGSHEDMIQPSEFLKIVGQLLMGLGQVATDDQKIEAVGCWLKTGSPAETWFNKTSTPKTKYANFAQAFKTEFKDVEKAEKSAPESEREISEMRIKTESLGRSEKY
jgi:hypothetical protein